MEYQFQLRGYSPIVLRDVTLLNLGMVDKIYKSQEVVNAIKSQLSFDLNRFLADPFYLSLQQFRSSLRSLQNNNLENISIFLPVINQLQQTEYFKNILCYSDEDGRDDRSALKIMLEALITFLISIRKGRILLGPRPDLSMSAFAKMVVKDNLIQAQFDVMMRDTSRVLREHYTTLLDAEGTRRRPTELYINDLYFTFSDVGREVPTDFFTSFQRNFLFSGYQYRDFITQKATSTELDNEIQLFLKNHDRS